MPTWTTRRPTKPVTSLLSAAVAIVIAAALTACGGSSSASSDGNGDPDTLRVALLPDESATSLIRDNQPLKDYLEKRIGKKIELVVTTDYSSMIEAMRRGRLELAYFGPLSYLLAQQQADIEPFAGLVDEGETDPVYYSVLITGADSGIASPAEVSDVTVAWGDPASTSSHLIPKSMLATEGLEPDEDYEEQFVGAHDAVALAVQNGNAEVGGLSKPILETLIDKGTIDEDRIRVLAESEPYPNYPWTVQSSLSDELKGKIRAAFLELDDPEVLEPLRADGGFDAVEDSDYDVVRDLVDLLGLEPEELAS